MVKRILVIGGGVIGVTTATALARRGFQVTLLEQASTLASGATSRNGAQLSYSYSDALGSPALLRGLPWLLCGFDPAFRVRLSVDPSFLTWVVRFLANCTSDCFNANTRAVLRLALHSRSELAALQATHADLMFHHGVPGKLHVYDDAEKFEAARSAMALKNAFGCDQRALSADEVVALEPALAKGGLHIAGGIHSPLDEVGDPQLFTQSLARIAMREHDLRVVYGMAAERFILDGANIRGVSTRHGIIEADAFVLTAGCDSPTLAWTAGIRLPIYPLKGYSATLPATGSSPRISITHTRSKIVFCRLDQHIRIAGMADLGAVDRTIRPHRTDRLLAAARRFLPEAADWNADPQLWMGLRPMTPDSRPIIGATPIPNLFLNSGHGMLGWTLACGSADLAAAVIAGENPVLASEFRLARFRLRTTTTRPVERESAHRSARECDPQRFRTG